MQLRLFEKEKDIYRKEKALLKVLKIPGKAWNCVKGAVKAALGSDLVQSLLYHFSFFYETCRVPQWDRRTRRWVLRLYLKGYLMEVAGFTRKHVFKIRPTLYRVKIKNTSNPLRFKVIHAIANTFVGGSTQLIIDLIEHIGHKYDMEVVTLALPRDGTHKGIVIHDFSHLNTSEEMAGFFRKAGADLLHIHYWGEKDTVWYEKVIKSLEYYQCIAIENVNTPVAAYEHRQVNHYVYVSEYARRLFGRWPENSSVIHPGINLDHFRPAEKNTFTNTIGMVYRLEPDKLREDGIQVFIEVVKRRPGTLVYIIGFGTFFRSYLNQVYEAGVRDNFIFTGCVPYKDLPLYYDKFSVFVAPVWRESFGQVTPFAMKKKLAVAGYNVGALSEILDGSDTLAGSVNELADKIIFLLENPDVIFEKGEQGSRRVDEHFSVETMVNKYDWLYERLLGLSKMISCN